MLSVRGKDWMSVDGGVRILDLQHRARPLFDLWCERGLESSEKKA
jgi:hypothetical protein